MANGFNPSTWPTFQQSMPIAQGAATGEELLRAHLQNQMQRQQNQSRPDLDAAKLAQMQASTQGQQISNVQSPEMLALKEYFAKIAARNAAHGTQNIQLQRDKMGALYANALARVGNLPAMQSAMSDDPNLMGNILGGMTGFGDKFSQVEGGQGPLSSAGSAQPAPQQQSGMQDALQQAYQKSLQYTPEQPMSEPKFPALQKYLQDQQAAPQPAPGQPVMPQPEQQAAPSQQPQEQQQGVPLEEIKRAQDATQSSLLKKTSTAQILNQRQYSGLLDDLIARTTPNMEIAIKAYSGLAGTKRLKKDQANSLLPGGVVTPELIAFNKVKNVATKFLANEVTRSLGESHNIATAEEMRKLANPIYWTKNPELALAEWKEFVDNSKTVSKSLSKSLAETEEQLRAISPSNDQSPQAQPSPKTPLVGSAASSGTVEMIDDQGLYHAVQQDDLEGATKFGWRKA